MLKMAVINQIFLAQVARKGSLVLPVVRTSTTAILSQYNVIFFILPKISPDLESNNNIKHFKLCNMELTK